MDSLFTVGGDRDPCVRTTGDPAIIADHHWLTKGFAPICGTDHDMIPHTVFIKESMRNYDRLTTVQKDDVGHTTGADRFCNQIVLAIGLTVILRYRHEKL